MDRRSFVLAASALGLTPFAARAADVFPSRPVRVISPYAAGGGPDVQLRQAGPALGEAIGQSIVIENKVGAGGVLAAQYVAQQPADGYTLLLGSNTHIIQKAIQPDLRFDPVTDFAPVSNLASSPTVLVVAADSPYQTLDDLLADARARPGRLNYGSGGIGTSAHLAAAPWSRWPASRPCTSRSRARSRSPPRYCVATRSSPFRWPARAFRRSRAASCARWR